MELKNLSDNTQRTYLTAVTGLTKHYQQSPHKLTQEMIQDYLLYLKHDRGNTPGTCANVVSRTTVFLQSRGSEKDPHCLRCPQSHKLPTVLTQQEICNLINAPKNLKHRSFS